MKTDEKINRSNTVSRLEALKEYLLRLLFPPKCIICKDLLTESSEMCPECLKVWKGARLSRCPVCQKTARNCTCSTFHLLSTDITSNKRLTALAFYGKFGSDDKKDILVRKLIYEIKTSTDRSAVRFAARELSHELLKVLILAGEDPKQWKITYPPRSKSRIRKYGFDHGLDLARAISGYTAIPFEKALENSGKSAQKSLNSLERKNNAKASYSIIEGFSPSEKYIICDDVVTTGATVNTAAEILKSAGAKQVLPICIARSKKKKRRVRRMAENPWFRSK